MLFVKYKREKERKRLKANRVNKKKIRKKNLFAGYFVVVGKMLSLSLYEIPVSMVTFIVNNKS